MLGSVEEIDRAFATMRSEQTEALMVQPPLCGEPWDRASGLPTSPSQHRLPTVSHAYSLTQVGGLMSYTSDVLAMARRSAVFVDKILKGAKPGDLPVEQPTKFALVINLKTARRSAWKCHRCCSPSPTR